MKNQRSSKDQTQFESLDHLFWLGPEISLVALLIETFLSLTTGIARIFARTFQASKKR